MSDRELLELAAKAYGATHAYAGRCWGIEGRRRDGAGLLCDNDLYWDPLTDDGDALRLAVKLGIGVYWAASYVHATQPSGVFFYESRETDDPYAATRRAIVRAAAAMGEVK